jgi:hypothetical protein
MNGESSLFDSPRCGDIGWELTPVAVDDEASGSPTTSSGGQQPISSGLTRSLAFGIVTLLSFALSTDAEQASRCAGY